MNGKCETIGTYATAKEAGMVRDEVLAVVGQGYCKFNVAQEDKCITDQQMRPVADFLNKHHYKFLKMAYPSSTKTTDLNSIVASNLLSKLGQQH